MSELALLGGSPVRNNEIPWVPTTGEEEINAVAEVMKDGHLSAFLANSGDGFLGGPKVRKMEEVFCSRFNVKNAIAVNSATTALQIAVAACGVGPGDEVLVSPYTMVASASAILLNGAVPVFVDIEESTYTMDPEQIERWISPRTKAILTVNIFGLPSNLPRIKEIAKKYNLFVIEDNAQSPGATIDGIEAGTMADIGVFSLNYHKVIQCGEGGVLLTNNDKLAYRCQLIRNHGEVILDEMGDKDTCIIGSNYRMSEIHAVIATEQLKKLDVFLKKRRDLADQLTEGLNDIEGLKGAVVPRGYTHSYYVYPIQFNADVWGISRKIFATAMQAEGFALGEGYVKPIYLMNVYKHKHLYNERTIYPFIENNTQKYESGICPVVEKMYFEKLLIADVCRLPYEKENITEFLTAIKKVWDNRGDLK